ncbi:MAG: hypothetical protein HYZ42_11925 [Bacteroidetes bacterium]|nr:hypothetical protein [Bacteroidota bacterium]
MQNELEKLKRENELLRHLLNEEQRERDEIAAIFHAKKSSMSVAIMLLSVLQKAAEKHSLPTVTYKDLNKLLQDSVDDLYKVYIDFCTPLHKLGGLINVLTRYEKKGWLWPAVEIKCYAEITTKLGAGEHKQISIFKAFIAVADYFLAAGYFKLIVQLRVMENEYLTMTYTGVEYEQKNEKVEVLSYLRNTLEARIILIEGKLTDETNWKDIVSFIVKLEDDKAMKIAQTHSQELKKIKEKNRDSTL